VRITVVASGSRGDLQAFIALASGLRAAGHRVVFATHRPYCARVNRAGLDFRGLSGDAERFFAGIAGIALRERWRRPQALAQFCDRFLGPFMDRLFVEAEAACADADAVLYWPLLRLGPPLAEKLGIPCFAVAHYPLPYQRTRAFPNPYFDPLRRPPLGPISGVYNLLTWVLGEGVYWRIFRRQLHSWRRHLGLRPLCVGGERRQTLALPHLLGFSPELLSKPRDWPASVDVTGPWRSQVSDAIAPSTELCDFVARGPAPVTIGFGSMIDRKPEDLAKLASRALERCGRRGVLLSGWGGLAPRSLSSDLFQTAAVDHDWLFPRSAAVVHHGGSGTTMAALRAGVASVIVPFGFDQPLWAHRMASLGAAPPALPARGLTVERLCAAIDRAVGDASFGQRAAELGARLEREDGIERAVALVEGAQREESAHAARRAS